eukprot:4081306-Prymnesium_polylepis.2
MTLWCAIGRLADWPIGRLPAADARDAQGLRTAPLGGRALAGRRAGDVRAHVPPARGHAQGGRPLPRAALAPPLQRRRARPPLDARARLHLRRRPLPRRAGRRHVRGRRAKAPLERGRRGPALGGG